VELLVVRGDDVTRDKVLLAPFDELLYLFIRRGSPTERALNESHRMEIHARHLDGDYSVRLVGHGHAGRGLAGHPERHALEPWAPEGVSQTVLLAAPFVPERVEFTRVEVEESRVRYHGPTDAALKAGALGRAWLRVAFGGVAFPFALAALIVPWIWLGVEGADYPGRPLALMLAMGGGLALLGGVRLLTLERSYQAWRAGRLRRKDAPVLSDGLLAAGPVSRMGWVMLLAGVAQIGFLSAWWGGTITWIALLANGGVLLGPAGWVHASFSRLEARD